LIGVLRRLHQVCANFVCTSTSTRTSISIGTGHVLDARISRRRAPVQVPRIEGTRREGRANRDQQDGSVMSSFVLNAISRHEAFIDISRTWLEMSTTRREL
jgi:hypothetical protein